ncbi:MAG: aminoacyl--tRNA ligase-related protein, partial [Thermoplasmata archaeon]
MKEKKENFNEWYNEVIEEAKLIDKRYPVKGMNVWLPYGWAIAKKMDEVLRTLMFETGHEEVYFPLLIPSDQFAKESEHIRGFGGEVFWVERGGNEKLDIPLILRPTSETAMYQMYSLWIRDYTDMPLRLYQSCTVFRNEAETSPFFRGR